MQPWYNTRNAIYWYDQYALNEHESSFARYDPDRITGELVDTGAGVIALYASNQYGITYYPSRHWPQHPGLGGRDYPGELAERLRRHGRRIVMYANWLDSKHPEWQFVPARGPAPKYDFPLVSWADPDRPDWQVRDLAGGGWLLPCIFSPHRTRILHIMREIAERYAPDGLHLDMVTFPDICVCDICRPELERICDTDELTSATIARHWKAVLDRQNGGISALMAEVAGICRDHGAISTPNFFAVPIEEAVRGNERSWLGSLDVAVSECFEAFRAPLTDLNTTSLIARWHRAIGKPSWILRTGHPMYYSHWPISKTQWEISAAACKANGVAVFGPCGVGARPDTTSARSLLEHARHGLEFFLQDSDLADSAFPDSQVALGWSWRTRRAAAPGQDAKAWAAEFAGWSRLLIEEHVPFDVLVIDGAEASSLDRYELIILPGLTNISSDDRDRLRDYVRNGGCILATGPTSLPGEASGQGDFALADVLGANCVGSVTGPFAVDVAGDAGPVAGRFYRVESRGTVLSRRIEVDSSSNVRDSDDPLPVGPGRWPTLCGHAYGRGRSVYAAFEVGRYFEEHGDWHVRDWMTAALEHALPERHLVVRAPRTVEATVWRTTTSDRLIVHLANRTVAYSLPTHRRQPLEIVPVHDVEIEIEAPGDEPAVSARQAQISWDVRDRKLLVRVRELGAYAAVVVDLE
jgi:hypothetical protein